ncbi:MAG: hypothetical protein U0M06_02185 [Clostridia bacterium]|nr:hypothetical protein [Clostridia bacterium]
MALTHEDFEEIKKELDERYVLQSKCSDKQAEVNEKFAKDDKRIDRLIDRMNLWNKLLWAIATSSIGALVIAFFELILK